MDIKRRNFINTLFGIGGLGSLLAVFYPVFEYLILPKVREPKVNSIKAGKASDFGNNGSKILKFGRKPVILIRDKQGEFHALAATCTHLECIVQFSAQREQIICACHNGVYDLSGRNVSGPPPKPLEEYNVNVVNEEIVITRAEA